MSVMLQCYSVIIYHGISTPGHGKEVVGGINAINKHYIYPLISNAQLIGSRTFYSQILMHSITKINYVSLTKEFQKHMSKENQKNGVIDQCKLKKIASKRKRTDIYYHV